MSAPLWPLLSKKIDYNWTAEYENAFQNIKLGVANIVELKHFDIHKDIRVVCDASHNGLGAVLEQLGTEGWRPISFALRFLNAAEKEYSTSELEMLAVVWRAKYFRNYIPGRPLTDITDHKALISLLNGNNKKNKTLFSRLTRWLDRLIQFDFVIEHKTEAKIGLADYLSRHPNEPPKPISQYDKLFTVAKLVSIRKSLGFTNNPKSLGKRNNIETKGTGSKQSRQFSSNENQKPKTCLRTTTVEGRTSCLKTPTNRKRSICISHTSTKSKGHSVRSIYHSLGRRFKQPNLQKPGKMDDSSDCSVPVIEIDSKINSPIRLDENLMSFKKIAVINTETEAITKNTRDSKINTVLSISSKFLGELFPTINPNQRFMSIIPRDCKVIRKSTALPELINLEFIASNLPADINLLRVKEALQKITNLKELSAEVQGPICQ